MSLGYVPGVVPQEWDAQWVEEEFRRLAELFSKMEMERAVLPPQAVAPSKVEEGIITNADGVNWNPGFGAGPYIYENGRWEPMSGKDFLIEVRKGKVPGHELILKFGSNKAASTTEQDVMAQGGTLSFLLAAETMDVVSTDTVNDISTGSNARTVKLIGLDATWTEITETVTLEATAVTTTNSFIRVYRMEVIDVGTYGAKNLGTISATASTAATVQSTIAIGESRSSTSHYTVPLGFNAQILRVGITVDTNKTADVHFVVREGADVVAAPFRATKNLHHWEGVTQVHEPLDAKHLIPEKSDMWFLCEMTSVAGEINVDYDILLVDNTL